VSTRVGTGVRTVSQALAACAWRALEARAQAEPDWQREYRSLALAVPALLHAAGLCQALAFAEARARGTAGGRADGGSPAASVGLQHSGRRPAVAEAYLQDLAAVLGYGSREALLRDSREGDLLAYIRQTGRALAAAGWLKRCSEALLAGPEGPEAEGADRR